MEMIENHIVMDEEMFVIDSNEYDRKICALEKMDDERWENSIDE